LYNIFRCFFKFGGQKGPVFRSDKFHVNENFFENFSNKTRIKIIETLLKKPKSVTEICKDINEEQSKVSHNLKKLAECNFVDAKQEGKKRIYSLNKDTLLPILAMVSKHVHKYCKEVEFRLRYSALFHNLLYLLSQLISVSQLFRFFSTFRRQASISMPTLDAITIRFLGIAV